MDMIKLHHNISAIKDKYNFTSKRMDKIKEIYKNGTTLSTAINELCSEEEKTTFGETIINTNISMLEIANIFNDFERIHPFENENGRTGRLLINYELLKNNLPPVVIAKEDRVKYFEFLRNNASNDLAEWLKEISIREEERMKRFGYKE